MHSPHVQRAQDGLVGGQHHDISGGGSNLLCLPHGPIWANTTKKFEDTATIYGSGYQFEAYATDPLFSFENAEKLNDHVAPCAVCVTRKPAAVMMLPGRTKCCSGWTIEYYGYLMSECDNGKGRHDYVCVDYAPETCPDIYVNKNGSSLHFVQTTNYTMPYQMYESGRELTCVVCSKY
ncbi:uncharacterized protein LOC128247004 [Octopus bimaculoides]|nr:uncharacterized protein LOC128247004 [Octopus bimaculoides]